jgi:hypothetical protein
MIRYTPIISSVIQSALLEAHSRAHCVLITMDYTHHRHCDMLLHPVAVELLLLYRNTRHAIPVDVIQTPVSFDDCNCTDTKQ